MINKSTQELKDKLLALLEKEALKRGNFILSSGKPSTYYLDGRVITLTPEGAYLVGSIILDLAKGQNPDAIGGPTFGACVGGFHVAGGKEDPPA